MLGYSLAKIEQSIDAMTADHPAIKTRVLLYKSLFIALDGEPLLCCFTPSVLATAVMGVEVEASSKMSDEEIETMVRVITKSVTRGVLLFLRGIIPTSGVTASAALVDGVVVSALKQAKVY